MTDTPTVAVVGLGYVGLPLAVVRGRENIPAIQQMHDMRMV